ncbi:sensor histidine kinase [Gandjariella thermophila]|uniref:histidine kinase n=1 Tax=Gandjariella thermophila TaxID=1931992 RepID=A0A4D4IZA0_9PSEU|nr:ATP-binding protein [Gandjariella thermophila]GDY29581.1 sensor histidine kinase [Gandjariella thermophila]
MCSSRLARRLFRRWSLRARLLGEQTALLAVVCLIIVVVTEFALHAFLVGQLDRQLHDASQRAQLFAGGPQQPGGGGPAQRRPPIGAPGQGAGTVNARIVDGEVVDAQRLTARGGVVPLAADQATVLARLPVDGRPYTRTLPDLGDFRAMAVTVPDGDVVVTGLPLADVDATMAGLGRVLAAVALAGLAATAGAGALIMRHTLRPLRRLARTASRVVELPLDRGEVALSVRVSERDTDPRTEVGQVGAALNRMLGHVGAALAARHASEMRVRQFVADASHELRTPLAAIRGYAELTRRGRQVVPPDVAHAIGRIESESARMSTLVDDLLLLARLDAGRPLAAEPVDLSRLVLDAVSDAHAAGRDHHWRLDVPEDPVTVVGDEARLHQVLANLLGNARLHTPPGTTVTTGLTTVDGHVRLTVADDGPGMPPELLPEVFERFARGDNSRSHAAGSTGLGLAIVAAVVGAHHGRVGVTSEPGRTVFTVELPVAR